MNLRDTLSYLRTFLISREVGIAIKSAELIMRPYALKAYFATALDIAESKGMISHPMESVHDGSQG